MIKIYYDENGWVCNRYPYDIPITDENRFIEVDDELYANTLSCEQYYAWRVVDGKLQIDRYEETPQQELYLQEYNNLKQQLNDMDYKTSKYTDGEYTEEEWQEIVTERKAIRVRVRELEALLNQTEVQNDI